MTTETLQLNLGEVYTLSLPSRGSTGLQMLFRTDQNAIVEITRIETPKDLDHNKPEDVMGASNVATFQIKALKTGQTRVTFYETRSWEKDFKEIIVKELLITVQ